MKWGCPDSNWGPLASLSNADAKPSQTRKDRPNYPTAPLELGPFYKYSDLIRD